MSPAKTEQTRHFILNWRDWVGVLLGLLVLIYSYQYGSILFYGGFVVVAWGSVGSYRYINAWRRRRTVDSHPVDKAHETPDFMLPRITDFPSGTLFMIKEFDIPLARVPNKGWFSWYGGTPRPYDSSALKVDNNWHADSFDEWVGVIEASLKN